MFRTIQNQDRRSSDIEPEGGGLLDQTLLTGFLVLIRFAYTGEKAVPPMTRALAPDQQVPRRGLKFASLTQA